MSEVCVQDLDYGSAHLRGSARRRAMSFSSILLTPAFCDRWKDLLRSVYGYRFEGRFALVPRLGGGHVRSYLPLLSYTDLTLDEARPLAGEAANRPHQVRVLNPAYGEFAPNDTVTMRIDLEKPSFDDVHGGIVKRTRRYIRDLQNGDYVVRAGKDERLVADFDRVFREVMHRLGTPAFGRRVFQGVVDRFDGAVYVVYRDGVAVCAALAVHDHEIAWIPWSGTPSAYLEDRPGLLMYWTALKDAYEAGKRVFDFGRSGYGTGTYEFKTRWGAQPVKIDILSDSPASPYSKYEAAANVWKRLPQRVADLAGPPLCKYLADL